MPKKKTRISNTGNFKSRRVLHSTDGKRWRGTTAKKVRRKKR